MCADPRRVATPIPDFTSFNPGYLLMPRGFIFSLNCQANTRVTASAFAASRMPSSSRNSSRVEPQCGFCLVSVMRYLVRVAIKDL
jgi:hypothetical protein